MIEETIKDDCSVSLIRENEDGSSDFQFNFPPEALAALTRLGILTAINAGIADAQCLNPDTPPTKQWVGLTEEEYQQIQRDCFQADQWHGIEAKLKEKNT